MGKWNRIIVLLIFHFYYQCFQRSEEFRIFFLQLCALFYEGNGQLPFACMQIEGKAHWFCLQTNEQTNKTKNILVTHLPTVVPEVG